MYVYIYIYIFPLAHMDNDSQLIQHRIISFFLLCANLMDISNKLAKHNNKYKYKMQQQSIIKTPNFYVENPSMRREKPRDLVQ